MARASSRTEPAQGQPSHEIEDLPGLDDLADAFLSLETPDEESVKADLMET